MKAHPIIFQPWGVRAIMADPPRKTMTRRLVKPQAESYRGDALGQPYIYAVDPSGYADPTPITCPYGERGDVLWVREALQVDCVGAHYVADGEAAFDLCRCTDDQVDWWNRAAGKSPDDDPMTAPATPSIFMPRWASRLLLRVESVRVERLQEISEDDVIAEGVEVLRATEDTVRVTDDYRVGQHVSSDPVEAFAFAWDDIQAKRPKANRVPWESNPYVWVVEFSRMEP